jgi:signal transduction histidine kinase
MTLSELERLTATVQRMLDFYRPDTAFQPVYILDLIERVLKLMDQQFRERNIRVSTAWPAKLPVIMAISNQVQQVLINLLLNAFDAMPGGGDLWITIRQTRKMVEIIFQDSGPGIPPELRASIFEPFVSNKPGGTGLGLSVSYDIIIAHGGSLDLLVDRGPGACFRILLPIGEPKEEKL